MAQLAAGGRKGWNSTLNKTEIPTKRDKQTRPPHIGNVMHSCIHALKLNLNKSANYCIEITETDNEQAQQRYQCLVMGSKNPQSPLCPLLPIPSEEPKPS